MADDLSRWARRVAEAPDDASVRSVFRDWLLEQGHTAEADWMGLEQRHHDVGLNPSDLLRFRDLSDAIDAAWKAEIARAPVEDCTPAVPLAFECPRRWEAMALTDDPLVRACSACERSVYWVDDRDQAIEHARLGHCVAIVPGLQRPPAPGAARPWPPDVRYPPGTVMAPPPHLEPTDRPHRPSPPDDPGPEPPKRPWWRRWFGG
ncbi:MAG: hypothetical protein R3F61_34150 [Myxococcota bacterium]